MLPHVHDVNLNEANLIGANLSGANMEEVATTIAYFSSPLSSATNGSIIKVEGGSTSGLS